MLKPMTKSKTPKRIRPTIKTDAVKAKDWLHYDHRFACEDCSHFNSKTILCTLGYQTSHHLQATQQRAFEMSGRIAFCRFHEID